MANIWLDGNHYKCRAMHTLGISVKYNTADGDNKTKFEKWAHAVPYTMRNPLYHWMHMEKLFWDRNAAESRQCG